MKPKKKNTSTKKLIGEFIEKKENKQKFGILWKNFIYLYYVILILLLIR